MAGESVNEYLKYKNVEYTFPTPPEALIQHLEDISIVDQDTMEV